MARLAPVLLAPTVSTSARRRSDKYIGRIQVVAFLGLAVFPLFATRSMGTLRAYEVIVLADVALVLVATVLIAAVQRRRPWELFSEAFRGCVKGARDFGIAFGRHPLRWLHQWINRD
jgi:hypothetical protein